MGSEVVSPPKCWGNQGFFNDFLMDCENPQYVKDSLEPHILIHQGG